MADPQDDERGLQDWALHRKRALREVQAAAETLAAMRANRIFLPPEAEPLVRGLAAATALFAGERGTSEDDSHHTDMLLDQLRNMDLTRVRGGALPGDLLNVFVASINLLMSLAATDECQKRLPYSPMRKIRKADGSVVLQCGHEEPDGPHESPA